MSSSLVVRCASRPCLCVCVCVFFCWPAGLSVCLSVCLFSLPCMHTNKNVPTCLPACLPRHGAHDIYNVYTMLLYLFWCMLNCIVLYENAPYHDAKCCLHAILHCIFYKIPYYSVLDEATQEVKTGLKYIVCMRVHWHC